MPKITTDPRLEGLPAGGQGSASAEEMARRFPEIFQGMGTPNTGNPELDESLLRIAKRHYPSEAMIQKEMQKQDAESRRAAPETEEAIFRFKPPGERPPEGFQPVDYSPEGRARFEQTILRRLGENPFEIDPYDYVEKINERLPEVFNHVFQGKVVWSDRDKLDKDQAKFWNNAIKTLHASIYDQAVMRKKVLTDQYNFMMNKFDNEAKAKEAAQKKIQELSKAPTTKEVVDKETGETRLYQWNPETKKFEDSGLVTKKAPEQKTGEVPEDVKIALGVVQRAASQINRPEIQDIIMQKFGGSLENAVQDKGFQDTMSQWASPEMKALLEKQWDIINKHYGLGSYATPLPETSATTATESQSNAEMYGVKKRSTLGRIHKEAPIRQPKTTRIKMQKDANGNYVPVR